MIRYKYSLIKDIKNAIWTLSDWKWFKEHPNIVVFWPNPIRWFWLMRWLFTDEPNVENINSEQDITCYWVSSGTWGAYNHGESSISICPWQIHRANERGLIGVIEHELLHLKHPEAEKLTHAEKEKFIKGLESNQSL